MRIPRSSADYYRRQQRILATLLLAVRQVWRRMDTSSVWSEQYTDDGVGAQLLMLVSAAQVAAARDADSYIAEVLAELDLVSGAQAGVVKPSAFAGIGGDGRALDGLFALAPGRAGRAFNQARTTEPAPEQLEQPEGVSDVAWSALMRERQQQRDSVQAFDRQRAASDALAVVGRWLEGVSAAVVIDAARGAEGAATAARPEVTGYVRMLNPPSCSRCVILAGRWYRWSDGFDRHPPTCDCRHIPASESIAGDLTVNPTRYFWSLSRADQDKTFTIAGAQAIRDGADINQVVNARRGMSSAQVGGRRLLVSSEGTTRFGRASRTRTGRNATQRLMPESIYAIADGDRTEAIRLLRLAGFIN